MAVHIEPSTRNRWEDEGEHIARDLAERSALLIVGADPRAAARVALGIARSQARRRRVAVVDAVGELAPIEKLLPDGVAHGLVDMLQHGVSLGKVATPVDRAGNLFVIPSGAAPLDAAEIFASDSWPRLTSSFRDAGALLLVVASEGARGSERVAPLFDGAVLVDDASAPTGLPVLAHAHGDEPRALPAVQAPPRRVPAAASNATRAPFWVAIAATVLAVAALGWWAVQSSLSTDPLTSSVTSAGAVVDGQTARAAATGDSAGDQTAASRTRSAEAGTGAAPAGAEPASSAASAPAAGRDAGVVDSSTIVPYGVALAQYNDVTAALTRIAQEAARGIPASTYAPFYDSNLRKQVFLVIAGAFHDRGDANSLLRSLRRQRVLASTQGHVIDAPFAVLVRAGLSAEAARSQLDSYRVKGLPVYALVQPDGTVSIYAGAFRSTEEAQVLLKELQVADASPRVARRAGRPAQ